MSQAQVNLYQSLLARAQAQGIFVAIHNKREGYNIDGSAYEVSEHFIVQDPTSSPKSVLIGPHGPMCNCPTAKRGQACEHAAVATAFLIRSAQSYSQWSDAYNMTTVDPEPADMNYSEDLMIQG